MLVKKILPVQGQCKSRKIFNYFIKVSGIATTALIPNKLMHIWDRIVANESLGLIEKVPHSRMLFGSNPQLNICSAVDVIIFGFAFFYLIALMPLPCNLLNRFPKTKPLAQKIFNKRMEISIGLVTAAAILTELFPLMSEGSVLSKMARFVGKPIFNILEVFVGIYVPNDFFINISDPRDIPFVLIGGIVSILIFCPFRFVVDKIRAFNFIKEE